MPISHDKSGFAFAFAHMGFGCVTSMTPGVSPPHLDVSKGFEVWDKPDWVDGEKGLRRYISWDVSSEGWNILPNKRGSQAHSLCLNTTDRPSGTSMACRMRITSKKLWRVTKDGASSSVGYFAFFFDPSKGCWLLASPHRLKCHR